MTQPGPRHLQDDIAAIKERLLEMSTMAEELVRMAVEALTSTDETLARTVIGADRDLDALEIELDEACINLLARQQPVARDLRFITMTMRISSDLERIGDHAVNISRAVERLGANPPIRHLREIDEMARIAREMLADALDSFIRGDAATARAVCRRDDEVDGLLDSAFRILLTHMMQDPRRIEPAMSLILVGRNIERIADLATNIAEGVVFLVEGKTIKHGLGRTNGPGHGAPPRAVA